MSIKEATKDRHNNIESNLFISDRAALEFTLRNIAKDGDQICCLQDRVPGTLQSTGLQVEPVRLKQEPCRTGTVYSGSTCNAEAPAAHFLVSENKNFIITAKLLFCFNPKYKIEQ